MLILNLIMIPAAHRLLLLSRVSELLKQRTGLTQLRSFAYTQRKTSSSFVRSGNAVTPQTKTTFSVMSSRGGNLSSSCSRCLSSSPLDASSQVKRVSIEGNIAVGKSTFAKLLQSACPDWEVVSEPVSKWQNIQSTSKGTDAAPQTAVSNLLDMMYQDPKRWSYTFQTYSCMSRLRTQLQPPPARLRNSKGKPVQVYERSVYSDRYIFALNMFELGCINATEWAVYQDWHSLLVEQFGHQVELEGIIYLRASPKKCMERLKCRGRSEEKEVKLDYLDKLHVQHEKWLVDKSTEIHFENLKKIPILQLDASVEFKSDSEVQEEFIIKVKNFFNAL